MSFAPNYTPTTSFANDETNTVSGRSTMRTVAIDTELADISASISSLKANAQKLQRDDDKLRDFLVEPYALAESTRALMATNSRPRGNWTTGVVYAVGDVVQNATIAYVAYTAHTASTPFIAAGFWIALSSNGDAVGSAIEASNSKAAALASQLAASDNAGDAAISAGAAAASATASSESAVTSGNAATAAGGSADAALVSRNTASDKAAEAQASTNAATATKTAIDHRYRGALAADPATRTDGEPNQAGDEYFSTPLSRKKVYNGTGWYLPEDPLVAAAIDAIKAFNNRGAFATATAYALKDIYVSAGIAYVAVIAHVSTSVAADVAAGKVTVHQGASREELAGTGGAGQVGYSLGSPGATALTVQKKLRERVSVFDFMTDAQIANVQAGTALLDVTAAILAGISATKNGAVLFLPAGVYRCDGGLLLGRGSKLQGENCALPDQRSLNRHVSRLLFTATTPGFVAIDINLADAELEYVWGVSLENLFIDGVLASGSIGINARYLANARFKSLGIQKFDRGLNVVFGMTNTFDSVSVQLCGTAALYMDNTYSVTTTQRFVDCAFRQSGWGAILSISNTLYMLDTVFDHCLFESNVNGGASIHKGCSVSFIDPYFENVTDYTNPDADPAGSAIRLFFDGNSTRSDTLSLCNIYSGDIAGPNGSGPYTNTLIDIGPGAAAVNVYGTLLQRGLNAIRVSATAKTGVVTADHISAVQVTNIYSGLPTQRLGLWPQTIHGVGFDTVYKNYSGVFGVPLRTDADALEVRNSANSAYYTRLSAAPGDVQSLSAIGPAGLSAAFAFKVQNSGTLVEVARLGALGYFKSTASSGSYAVPNVAAGAGDAFHHIVANVADKALAVSNLSAAPAAGCVVTSKPDSVNGYHFQSLRTDTAGIVYQVLANGNVQNANNIYAAVSDVKLKQDIADTGPKLADLLKVRVVNYALKSDPTHKQLGVIAQEVESIFPGLVDAMPDVERVLQTRIVDVPALLDEAGNELEPANQTTEEYFEGVDLGTVTKSVKYSLFVPMLIKAMQEQQAMIDSLSRQVAELRA